jgi:hypothetical protein
MRFFDLQDKGMLSKLDFFKAIAKCGVVIDTHVLINLLQGYGLNMAALCIVRWKDSLQKVHLITTVSVLGHRVQCKQTQN